MDEKDGRTVKQVAELSGVSVRTLHWYEEMGLLVPRRAQNGYRLYSQADLERLQHILLWRDCGVELADIGRMLDDPGFDARAALESHLMSLSAEKARIETLIATVTKTIAHLEGAPMTDEERFEGLKREAVESNERTYGAEARAKYGDEADDAANERLLAMDEATWNDMQALEGAIVEQLKAAMATGDAAGTAARDLARMHARWIGLHWGEGAYSREAHLGLAHGYLADPRFTAYYDERAGEGATQFLVDAIEANLA